MPRLFSLFAAAAALAGGPVWGGLHPLAPLTADEIREAARVFRASGRFPASGRFSTLTLQEPPKESVLRGLEVPRRAFAVIYDGAGNRAIEAVANLGTRRVDSWKEIPNAQPAVDQEDSAL